MGALSKKIPSLFQERGATLLEQLVAIAILGIAVLLPASQISLTEKAIRRAQIQNEAQLLARSVTEDLLLEYSSNPDLDDGVTHTRHYNRKSQLTTPTLAYFTVNWVIVRHSPIRGIAEVKLTLSWNDAMGPGALVFWTARVVRR